MKIGLKSGAHPSAIENEITPADEIPNQDLPSEDGRNARMADQHLEYPVERMNEQQLPISEGMHESTGDNNSNYMSLDYIMHTMDDSTPQNGNLHGEIPLDPLLFQAWIYDECK
jgi:hypothetical protein